MAIYLSLLPNDLLSNLLLDYLRDEFNSIVDELDKISTFRTKLWNTLYPRYISSILLIPSSFTFEDYMNIVNKYKEAKQKIYYFAREGYDKLLYPLLKTKDDYNAAYMAAIIGNHIPIIDQLQKHTTLSSRIQMEHLKSIEDYIDEGLAGTFDLIYIIGDKYAVDLILKYSGKGPKPIPIPERYAYQDFDYEEVYGPDPKYTTLLKQLENWNIKL